MPGIAAVPAAVSTNNCTISRPRRRPAASATPGTPAAWYRLRTIVRIQPGGSESRSPFSPILPGQPDLLCLNPNNCTMRHSPQPRRLPDPDAVPAPDCEQLYGSAAGTSPITSPIPMPVGIVRSPWLPTQQVFTPIIPLLASFTYLFWFYMGNIGSLHA